MILIELVALPKRRKMVQCISLCVPLVEICDPKKKPAFLKRLWLRCYICHGGEISTVSSGGQGGHNSPVDYVLFSPLFTFLCDLETGFGIFAISQTGFAIWVRLQIAHLSVMSKSGFT